MERDTIFISHATPDDNDFVRWLGTRLTGHGYKIWADLFELKGGIPFWNSIENALRNHARKVVFVVSKKSVDPERSGIRNELSVADTMKKSLGDTGFIIPVKIDDTPFTDLPIQIHQLNAIDFSKGWGPKLVELLETLEDAKVPTFPGDQMAAFELWRATMVRTSTLVEAAPEPVLTNWLPINSLPANITFFEHDGDVDKVKTALRDSGIPHTPFYRLIIAFADLAALQAVAPQGVTFSVRATQSLDAFLDGGTRDVTSPKKEDARNMATSMLRQHVERHLERRGLKRILLSSGSSFYFSSGLVANNKVSYVAASGRKTNKNVVGRSERNQVNWHLSMKVNVVLGQAPHVRFKPYVCFSEDGQNALTDTKRTSAIRRRFCKNWWNQHWRQLQEAFSVFLADGNDATEIALDGPEKLILAGRLLELTAVRKMPDDLKFTEEPDDPVEPVEPDDEADDGFDEPLNPEWDEVA